MNFFELGNKIKVLHHIKRDCEVSTNSFSHMSPMVMFHYCYSKLNWPLIGSEDSTLNN
jgi:hypothetical protein